MQDSRDNESMEAGVSGYCGRTPGAKVLSVNSVAVVWGYFS